MKVLVTGGSGFIGSNYVRYLLAHDPEIEVVVLDSLTYAGNLDNLEDIAESPSLRGRYKFVQANIADPGQIGAVFSEGLDAVLNFAAESHVDRSISDPQPFVRTNCFGTYVLLEAARRNQVKRFLQVSTDEVYGSAPEGVSFGEDAPLRPSNPYAATKAAADLLVLSYVHTFEFPALVARCSNNYGPYQFPDKLIPLMIANALENKPLPVYGDGLNVRDWIYVEDHCRAIHMVLRKGRIGGIYNVGDVAPRTNLEVVRAILRLLGQPDSLIRFVQDRPGHDRRYAICSTRLRTELGWSPRYGFEEGLAKTVAWYRDHGLWLERCRNGQYRNHTPLRALV